MEVSQEIARRIRTNANMTMTVEGETVVVMGHTIMVIIIPVINSVLKVVMKIQYGLGEFRSKDCF